MGNLTLQGVSLELEYLRMRVTALEKALDAAGIEIPPNRAEIAAKIAAEDARMNGRR